MGFSPRWFLQTLGTEFLHDMVAPDVLIKRLSMDLEPLLADGKKVVITDVRMPEEVAYIELFNGLDEGVALWKVDASERVKNSDTHRSENGLPNTTFDAILDNNKEKQDLIEQIERHLANHTVK